MGATAVLVSQFLAWLGNGRRLKLELEQKERESLLRYSEPIRDKWLDALEQFHELLQDVLENGRLLERDYLKVRAHFAYIDDDLRTRLLNALPVSADGAGPLTAAQRTAMLQLQADIRAKLAIPDAWRGKT